MNRRSWVSGGQGVPFGKEHIWYRVDGAGPTILFALRAIVEKLAARHRCVCFDFLGFGASSKPRRAYSYPREARILELRGVGHYPQLEALDEVASFVDATATSWRERR